MLWWTLQNLVVAGLAAGVIALACRVAHIGPAGRHALWLVVLMKLVTPPLVVLDWPSAMPRPRDLATRLAAVRPPVPAAPVPAAPSATSGTTSLGAIATHATGTAALAPVISMTRVAAATDVREPRPSVVSGVLAGLPVVWLAGALAFALIQSVRIARLARRVRVADTADPALVDEVDAVARQMRVRSIPIRVSSDIPSPMIWCVLPWRPILLWPATPPAQLSAMTSDACRRGLIVHELAHVKRRDHWVGWLELAAGCLWWWNPLFWYVRSRVRENAELACDGWVIDACPEDRRAYAEALLAVCAGMPRDALAPAIGVSTGNRRLLERRLAMIMRERPPLRLSRLGLIAVTLLAFTTLPLWAQKVANVEIGLDARPIPNRLPTSLIDLGARTSSPAVAAQTNVRASSQTPMDDVQRLIDRFAEQEAEAHREADEKIAQRRQELIQQLQSMQEALASAGELDRAVAVRDRISQLREQPPGNTIILRNGVLTNGNVELSFVGNVELRDGTIGVANEARALVLSSTRRVGETITLPVVGSTRGLVWGDGIYTDDSSLAAAAVHAGILAPGELGLIAVTILPGQNAYGELTSNGVRSLAYGQWDGSFSVHRAPGTLSPESGPVRVPGDDASVLPIWLNALRGHSGVSLLIEVVGARPSSENIWGTDVYTDDSSIAAAAVHAGVLREGERGLVKITVLPGRDRYVGSERNGIASEEYGKWDGSFRIDRAR